MTLRELETITGALKREKIAYAKYRDLEPIGSYYWNCWQDEIKHIGELEDRLYSFIKTINWQEECKNKMEEELNKKEGI